MAEPVAESAFSATEGLEDRRVLFLGAKTLYETGDFATGAKLVAAIADIVAEVGHAPLIDLRPDTVTVQLLTIGVGLSDLDVELGRRISAAAAQLGLKADPGAVQQVEFRLDTVDRPAVMGFWRAALGYVPVAEDYMVEPNLIGPTVSFGDKAYVPPRNRIHVDVAVPHDQAQARVSAVLAAGGRMLGDKYAPTHWSLIDAEGNVVDIATWQGRDEEGSG